LNQSVGGRLEIFILPAHGEQHMKSLLLAAIFATAASGPAWAQTTGSLGPHIMNDPGPRGSGGGTGGGLNLGHVFTGAAAAASTGTAAAGSLANGITTNIGAGFAATYPVGGTSTGLGASGAAITGAVSNNIGVGGGFTNVLP
jgi:hypothetical protein